MVSDPRCPNCDGKVSATAMWCMHCGADFDSPVDADTGRAVEGRHRQRADLERALNSGDVDELSAALDSKGVGSAVAGVAVAFAALLTLPWVSPPNMTALYLGAVVGIGIYAARQASVGDAIRKGGRALAAAPFALWLLAPLVNGVASFALGTLLGPLVYAVVVVSIARQFG